MLAAVLLLAGTLAVPVTVTKVVGDPADPSTVERSVETRYEGAWTHAPAYVDGFSSLYRGLVGAVLACAVAVFALLAAWRGRGASLAGAMFVLGLGVLLTLGAWSTIWGDEGVIRAASVFVAEPEAKILGATVMAVLAAVLAAAAGAAPRRPATRWLALAASTVLLLGIATSSTLRAYSGLALPGSGAAGGAPADTPLIRRHVIVDQLLLQESWELFWSQSLVVIAYALLGIAGLVFVFAARRWTWPRTAVLGIAWFLLVGGSLLSVWQVIRIFDGYGGLGRALATVMPTAAVVRVFVLEAGLLLALALGLQRLLVVSGSSGDGRGGTREDREAELAAADAAAG